jgi:CheY-like chemotaxis protein
MVEDRSQEGRKHVFAINGAPEFLNLVRELFQEERYNVTTTNYVPNSFAQIAALQPDALIVDVVVGQSAGWELLDRAREEAERYGDHRYLAKPFELDDLLGAIDAMIGPA